MANAPAAPPASAEHWLGFRIDKARYSLPAQAVREIIRPPMTTRVPHGPDSLIGLANLRGQVLPVVALGRLLGSGSDGHQTGSRVIVLERADPIGVLVDEVSPLADSLDHETRLLDLEPLLATAFQSASPRQKAVTNGMVTAQAAQVEDEVVLLAFSVSGQDYALPIAQIEEVMPLPEGITVLPMADAVALGTIARRDALLPLLSLRLLLGLAAVAIERRPQVLIARIGTQNVGLVVDAIQSMLRVPESAIDAVPVVLARGKAEARIQAICRLDGGARLLSILATEHLLRADQTSQLMRDTQEEQRMANDGSEIATEQFLIFRVGDQDFGLPIAAVREVTTLPDTLTRLPRAPAFVEGMMNLRGQVIPVIDQGRRFDGMSFNPASTAQKRRRVIVTALGQAQAGFLVDAVAEVRRVPVSALASAPELVEDRTRVFDRVATLDDGRMILIVEPRELLDRAERDLLAAMSGPEGPVAS